MADIDLNLLTALDALLAEGSVARAARRLGLSASAMSRTLARLRATTGDSLLVRAGRSMVPTPHALQLRERVRDLAQDARTVLRPAALGLDLATLKRRFTLRSNDDFVEIFAARIISATTTVAPGVRLHFKPKPDKSAHSLREGLVDLEIGVLGTSGPEVRLQALFRDYFIFAMREGHPLLEKETLTAADYAACGHVVASHRGFGKGPVDEILTALGLSRTVVAVVPSFRAALTVASQSNLVALVTNAFFNAAQGEKIGSYPPDIRGRPLPVPTTMITVSQMWHPRQDADPAHRWLRGVILSACGELSSLAADAAHPRFGRKNVAVP